MSNCYSVSTTRFQNYQNNQYYSFSFNCSSYEFIKVYDFGTTDQSEKDTLNQANCVNFTSSINLQIEPSCKMQEYLDDLSKLACQQKSYCTVQVPIRELHNRCPILNTGSSLYVSYLCLDRYIELGNSYIDRSGLAFLLVYIDVAGILVFLFTIIIIKWSYTRLNNSYKETEKNINQYTINIKSLSLDFSNVEIELNYLAIFLDGLISNSLEEAKSRQSVYPEKIDIKLNSDNVNNIQIKNDEHERKHPFQKSNVNIYGENKSSEMVINPDDKHQINNNFLKNSYIYEINYPYISDKKLSLILNREKLVGDYLDKKAKMKVLMEENAKPKKMENLKASIEKKRDEINKTLLALSSAEVLKSGRINDIFITFTDPKFSKFIYNSYNKTKCTRCCYIMCCNYNKLRRFYYKNAWLEVKKNPDNPSNIKWQNMLVSKCNKCFSKSFSIILSTFLILIGFGIIVGSKVLQDNLNQEFNTEIRCEYVDYNSNTAQTEFFNTLVPNRNKVQTYCFCQKMYNENGYSYTNKYSFPGRPNEYPCKNWVEAFFKFTAISYAITVSIPILNTLITFFLTFLTRFEKNKSLTSDKSSNMIKIFIGQFINTGLLLLIVNTKIEEVKTWSPNFPIFNGLYKDLDSGWFKNIGCTIFFTMIISIVTPHIGAIIGFTLITLKRCFNSGNQKGTGSNITSLRAFLKLYVGPELAIDTRYAQVFIKL